MEHSYPSGMSYLVDTSWYMLCAGLHHTSTSMCLDVRLYFNNMEHKVTLVECSIKLIPLGTCFVLVYFISSTSLCLGV